MDTNIVWLGFIASLLAGLGSGVGALGVFVFREISERAEDVLLSIAAGIMLAASFFSLILPGIEHAEAQVGLKTAAVAIVIGGIFIGAWALFIIVTCPTSISSPASRGRTPARCGASGCSSSPSPCTTSPRAWR